MSELQLEQLGYGPALGRTALTRMTLRPVIRRNSYTPRTPIKPVIKAGPAAPQPKRPNIKPIRAPQPKRPIQPRPTVSANTVSKDYPATKSYTEAKKIVKKLFADRYNHRARFATIIKEAQKWYKGGDKAYSRFISYYDKFKPSSNIKKVPEKKKKPCVNCGKGNEKAPKPTVVKPVVQPTVVKPTIQPEPDPVVQAQAEQQAVEQVDNDRTKKAAVSIIGMLLPVGLSVLAKKMF